MILSIFDNEYFKIFLVIILSMMFLMLFSFCASLATKIARKNKFRKMDDNDKTARQSKLYELIFSRNGILLEEFKDYFTCDLEVLKKDLVEMCNNNIVREEEGKYYINR